MRYFPAPLSESETEAFYLRIQQEFAVEGWGLYAVEIKATGRFIGYVGLHEIGFEADFTPGVGTPTTTTTATQPKPRKQF